MPDMTSISMIGARNGLMSLSTSIGLNSVSMTSGEDHAHSANPTLNSTTVRITVMIVDRIISLRSGISSLNVSHTGLGVRDVCVSHLKIPTDSRLFQGPKGNWSHILGGTFSLERRGLAFE
jgi:hypothetical protein